MYKVCGCLSSIDDDSLFVQRLAFLIYPTMFLHYTVKHSACQMRLWLSHKNNRPTNNIKLQHALLGYKYQKQIPVEFVVSETDGFKWSWKLIPNYEWHLSLTIYVAHFSEYYLDAVRCFITQHFYCCYRNCYGGLWSPPRPLQLIPSQARSIVATCFTFNEGPQLCMLLAL